jgi:hypothetical protein
MARPFLFGEVMVIDTLSNETYALTNSVNYSTNGYPSRIPTTTAPSGDGVIPMGHMGGYSPNHLILVPFGVGSSTNTFTMQILGWRATKLPPGQPASLPLWIPVNLGEYTITLGTATGVAGADLTTTSLFNTTITFTGGPTFVTAGAAPVSLDWLQISPGSNKIGMISVRSFGFRFMETIYSTGGSATSCNSLYCKM